MKSLHLIFILSVIIFGNSYSQSKENRNWNGSVSSDWFTSGNWNEGTPPSSDIDAQNIIIPSTANNPNIGISPEEKYNPSMWWVKNRAILSLSDGSSLEIKGVYMGADNNTSDVAQLTIDGGTVRMQKIRIAIKGTGSLIINDGSVEVYGSEFRIASNSSATGTIHLNGGILISSGSATISKGSGAASIIVSEGIFKVKGDRVSELQALNIIKAKSGYVLDAIAYNANDDYTYVSAQNTNPNESWVSWHGAESSQWGAIANWSTNVLPTQTDNVDIQISTNSPIITEIVSVKSIVNAFVLDVKGSTLTVENDIALEDNSILNIDGGTVTTNELNIKDAAYLQLNAGLVSVKEHLILPTENQSECTITLNGGVFEFLDEASSGIFDGNEKFKLYIGGGSINISGNKLELLNNLIDANTIQAQFSYELDQAAYNNIEDVTSLTATQQESNKWCVWDGNTSYSWNQVMNWRDGITPTNDAVVVINPSTFKPIVTGDIEALSIRNNHQLKISNGAVISLLSGSFRNAETSNDIGVLTVDDAEVAVNELIVADKGKGQLFLSKGMFTVKESFNFTNDQTASASVELNGGMLIYEDINGNGLNLGSGESSISIGAGVLKIAGNRVDELNSLISLNVIKAKYTYQLNAPTHDVASNTTLLSALKQVDVDKSEKPNIIIVITDDQGYGDLGCTGNPWIQTPNIDKFSQESVSLTDFHVSTTCSPSRGALLTGYSSNRCGAFHTLNTREIVYEGITMMPEVLKENGYSTSIFGKWHLGDNYPFRPQDRGFDETLIHLGGGVGQTSDYWGNRYFDDTYFRNGKPEQTQGYCTDVWFENAMNYMDEQVANDTPFFCYLSTNAPHSPFYVGNEYINLYQDKAGVVWPPYYGMITNLDDNMGTLLDYLDTKGISDNTIVIFMTDNGTNSGAGARYDENEFVTEGYNAGMRGKKGSKYEGGHRVPFIIRWPQRGIEGGYEVDELTAHLDFFPTLVDAIGLTGTDEIDFEGESIYGLLTREESEKKDRVIVTDTQRSYYLEKWKKSSTMMNKWRLIDGVELYDLASDPEQSNDVAAENQTLVTELRAAYEDWWSTFEGTDTDWPTPPLAHEDEPEMVITHLSLIPEGSSLHWLQTKVRNPGNNDGGGYYNVRVDEAGLYKFSLYRYPPESNLALTAAAPYEPAVPNTNAKAWEEGQVLPIKTAKVTIGDHSVQQDVDKSATHHTFTLNLEEGVYQLRPLFINDDYTVNPVIYTVVERAETTDIDLNPQEYLEAYPNPTNNLLHFSKPIYGSFQVIDTSGRVVMTEAGSIATTQLNVSSLLNGIYIISIEGKDGVSTQTKFVKN